VGSVAPQTPGLRAPQALLTELAVEAPPVCAGPSISFMPGYSGECRRADVELMRTRARWTV